MTHPQERDSASARRHVVERPLKTGEMGSFDTRRESCKVFGFEAGERVMVCAPVCVLFSGCVSLHVSFCFALSSVFFSRF